MSIEKVKCVQVKFRNYSPAYTYITNLDLERGDCVIVDTPRNGFTVATVVGNDDTFWRQNPHACKWIVQKIDTAEYNRLRKLSLAELSLYGEEPSTGDAPNEQSRKESL